ncbi:MAG: aldo/keto reductase [Elusimicrobiota bacterium]
MKYRPFGKTGWNVSSLGFGCMRLPHAEGKPRIIDEPETIRQIRFAVDHGVNYLDTAYQYYEGGSEKVVGLAVKDGYREKVKIATKSPVWLMESPGDFDKYLDISLQRLQVDHIDFYLLHGLRKTFWENVVKHDLIKQAENAKRAGKVGYVGFSFHDNYSLFEEIINAYDKWDFCQIQYNYINVNYQAGLKGLKYASGKGLPIVIMEPLLGGRLAKLPKVMNDVINNEGHKHTPVDLALQWLWNQPEVTCVLSGMNKMSEVEHNINSAEKSGAGSLTSGELELITRLQEVYKKYTPVPCTSCGYCIPCPNSVRIPNMFAMYNNGYLFENMSHAKEVYANISKKLEGKTIAGACIKCGKCEEKCPQHIPISEWLEKIHKELSGDNK